MEEERLKKLVDVVKRMNQERVQTKDIVANLRTLGLASFEIDTVLREAQIQPTTQEIHDSVTKIQESIESGSHLQPVMDKIEEHKEVTEKLQQRVQEMHGEITEQKQGMQDVIKALREHREKLEAVHSGLIRLEDKHDDLRESLPAPNDQKEELDNIKTLILELRPMIAALMDINEKILETNRELLARLKMKD